ncbi:hypothetical protein ACFDTO_17180 [Microbacteriaceae bacterium 4G12]
MTAAALAAHMQMVLVDAVLAATPSPTPGFDQTTVTPGVAGFLITFGVAAVALLLALDMTRRIRRTRYREEIRAKLEAERDGRPAPGTDPDGTAGTIGTAEGPRTP